MLTNKDISTNDKIILEKLGKDADIPVSDLLLCTKYRRKSSIYNRIRNLEKEKYLYGPYFDINYNAIGTNKLYSVFVLAEYNQPYRAMVLNAMKKINCWTMIYPVRTAEVYLGVYRCNNWNYVASLFNLMKKWDWLKAYSVHSSEHRWIVQNPDFFGGFIPPHNYQIPGGEPPQYWYENLGADVEFTEVDLVVLKYMSRKTIHLTQIRDLEYHYYGLKLKYHDLKKSYEKLRQNRILIKRFFIIFPLPTDICSFFFFISKGRNFRSHLNLITHFGKDLRLTKVFIVTGNKIIVYFMTHPLLEGRILGILENEVDYANIYGIKTYPSTELFTQTFNDYYFDLDNQRWTFPYSEFKEEIEKLKEKKE